MFSLSESEGRFARLRIDGNYGNTFVGIGEAAWETSLEEVAPVPVPATLRS